MKVDLKYLEELLENHKQNEKLPCLDPAELKIHLAIYQEEHQYWHQFVDNTPKKLTSLRYDIYAHIIQICATIQLLELTIKQLILPVYGTFLTDPLFMAYLKLIEVNEQINESLFHDLHSINKPYSDEISKRNMMYWDVVSQLQQERFSDRLKIANLEFENGKE